MEFYNKHFPVPKIDIHSRKILFKMLKKIARLRLVSQGIRKKFQSFDELYQKEHLEPDEGLELMVKDLIDASISHSLLHPETPFGSENM